MNKSMKTFKEGDKVRIKDNLTLEDCTPTTHILPSMLKYAGYPATILTIDEDGDCLLDVLPESLYWSSDWLEEVENGNKEEWKYSKDKDLEKSLENLAEHFLNITSWDFGQTWEPTMQLRWKNIVDSYQLQQLWQSSTGNEEWRSIQYVD